MVLHNPRISERGFTMFFAVKEALLNVTKTMNPHPEKQLHTEELSVTEEIHLYQQLPSMHLITTSLLPGQQRMAPQHGVP